jgi:hypothetical protein
VRSGAVTSEGDILSPESITPDLMEPDDQCAADGDPDGREPSDHTARTPSRDESDGADGGADGGVARSTPAESFPADASDASHAPHDWDASDEGSEPTSTQRAVAELPDAVRLKIIEWAAEVLSSARPIDIPTSLSRVARFAPAKRARLAAAALSQAVQNDTAFRALVAERAANTTDDVGAVSAAARGYLLRSPDEQDLINAAADAVRDSDARARVAELERTVRKLTSQSERLTSELESARRQGAPDAQAMADTERLRQRLRDQGTRLRDLQQEVDAGATLAAERVTELTADLERARAEAATWRQRAETEAVRADAAQERVSRMREASTGRRAASDRRIELLLGALEGAATGLRREWDLLGGGDDPADVVAARLSQALPGAERTADPSRLTSWLGLPGAHLIVDGYNVTKTGYPELSLAEQRDRLIRALAALAARTSAEVTVVFDGAAVTTARPPGRGIRVLFSPPGVIADDVIRDLVRAEPAGRVLIVVSSDRQIVEAVSRDGARTAGSTVLLAAAG